MDSVFQLSYNLSAKHNSITTLHGLYTPLLLIRFTTLFPFLSPLTLLNYWIIEYLLKIYWIWITRVFSTELVGYSCFLFVTLIIYFFPSYLVFQSWLISSCIISHHLYGVLCLVCLLCIISHTFSSLSGSFCLHYRFINSETMGMTLKFIFL